MGYAAIAVGEEREAFAQASGSYMLDLSVSHGGKPGEHVTQVGMGIDAAVAATLDNGVKDGAALAGLGIAQEQPVLFAQRSTTPIPQDSPITFLRSVIFWDSALRLAFAILPINDFTCPENRVSGPSFLP